MHVSWYEYWEKKFKNVKIVVQTKMDQNGPKLTTEMDQNSYREFFGPIPFRPADRNEKFLPVRPKRNGIGNYESNGLQWI